MVISVITICYNAENDIERTLRSVLCQTFNDLEYIIVDGASRDNTVGRIKAVMAEYPQRKVILISEPDKGIYDAMNKGIRRASGEWLCMMNAGDMFADNEVLQKVFSSPISNSISFLYSDFYKATHSGRYFRVKTSCTEHEKVLVHQSIIYRRCLHKEHGYYVVTPNIIVSDYLFFLQIPVEQTLKTDIVIAKYEGNGVSETGSWCKKQAICADVTFRHTSFWFIYLRYFKWQIKRIVPSCIRERLNLYMYGVRREVKL